MGNTLTEFSGLFLSVIYINLLIYYAKEKIIYYDKERPENLVGVLPM